MAKHAQLARTYLPAFRALLTARGWVEQPKKGGYEIARFTRDGAPPLLLFARASALSHVTVLEKDWPVVQQFLKDKHSQKV